MSFDPTKSGLQTVRIPFLDQTDIRANNSGLLKQDRIFVNGYFEPVPSGHEDKTEYHFVKRPGLTLLMSLPTPGIGRGFYQWSRTGKVYSVVGNKIFSNTTDLGITLTTTTGLCGFAETRPGATTQYLGINDGSSLWLVGTDDSLLVLNNVAITSSSVANPTVITANNHGLITGNKIIIRGHAGSTPSLNDTIFTITKTGTNTFTIPVNVTVGGAGGTIGVFPIPNTSDLQYMDGYWFTVKADASVWNCLVDDPTNWPITSFINAQMSDGVGIGLGRQNNVLVVFSDKHTQMFYDAANPVGSPLANIEQAMQQVGCVASNSISSQENTVYWVSNTLNGGFSIYRLDGTTNLDDIGTPALNRSLFNNLFPSIATVGPKTIILKSGTTWTVPTDFNKNNNTIEAIGGAGGGTAGGGSGGTAGGNGGGAGAYAKISNFDPAGATTIPFTVGSGGFGATYPNPGLTGNGGDTTFNTATVIAKGGLGAGGGGTGGTAAASTGTTKFSGGNGGTAVDILGSGGGGGGGAGGKLANGANGANSVGSTGANGGQGDPLIGGVGGVGGLVGTPGSVGSTGGEWISAGSGGGGGGGGGASNGGNGGNYGAGGAGAGGGTLGTQIGGTGTQGLIAITYTPAVATADTTIASHILRIAGHIFYAINLLTVNETWIYDQQLKIWTKWTAGSTGAIYWPIVDVMQFSQEGQQTIIAGQDATTGTIWKIDTSVGQDNGVNYPFIAQTNPLTFGTMQRKFYAGVEVVGDHPQTSTIPVVVSYSDSDFINVGDGTIVTGRTLEMAAVQWGTTNQVTGRTFSKNWGNSRRRSWRFSYTGSWPSLRVTGFEFELLGEA